MHTQLSHLLSEWNETTTAYPRDKRIDELFEAEAEYSPDAIAVVFEEQHLCYKELNARANALAHTLRQLGVRPEVVVGLCLERSLDLIVGLLAILKAGGAYLPLDVSYPQQRLTFMMQDAEVSVLLTQERLQARIAAGPSVHVLCLEQWWDSLEHPCEDAVNPVSLANAENLAYVMYTSGSTGTPKGVSVTHRNVVRLVKNTTYATFSAKEVFLQLAPIAFDASTFEIWGCMLNGGRLVLFPAFTPTLHELAQALERYQITTLWLTAGLFHQMVEDQVESLRHVRQLLAGGDVLSVAHVQQVLAHDSGQTLINGYGPTEGTTFTCCYAMLAGQKQTFKTSVPIGGPIANTQVYVLDEYGQPTPPGVSGELYIGGDGLARGYLHRPDLTAEKFVPHAFSNQPGARLYYTGDMVRYRNDGTLEFLGRADQQVKLRGFRVELGEIETALRQHAVVQDAVVLLREDAPGDKRLVGYVVPHEGNLLRGDGNADGATSLMDEQVEHWQQVFDETYGEAITSYYLSPGEGAERAVQKDPTLNIVGWNSSYTGLPIPAAEMREWVDRSVERILHLRPERVLEIGCGTGLLLLRIAPICSEYTGTDFSQAGLNSIQQQMRNAAQAYTHVKLLHRMADDFTDMQEGMYDTVIINSVIQYFPDVSYLLRVLEGALRVVRPGGRLFVGDVRSLPLLEAFHTSVELYQAVDSLPTERLWHQIRQQMAREAELVVDPALFYALKQRFPQISHVDIHLKRGYAHNEVTCFRYDAELFVGDVEQVRGEAPTTRLDWQKASLGLAGVRQLLLETRPEVLRITGVPNARLTTEMQARELLTSEDGRPETVGELRAALQRGANSLAAEPEEWWKGYTDLPYAVSLLWSEGNMDGSYEVVLRRDDPANESAVGSYRGDEAAPINRPRRPAGFDAPISLADKEMLSWEAYATHPLYNQQVKRLVATLRNHLKRQLPDYMIPSTILLLDTLPLTPIGKVDRRAFPAPQWSDFEREGSYEAPQTPLEEQVATIWREVLHLERVGVHDNFFALGGHSLLAAQLVSRMQKVFQVEVSLRTLFDDPTVAALTRYLQRAYRPPLPPISAAPREEHMPTSFAQERLWFLDQLEMGSAFYNVLSAVRLRRQLKVAVLQESLNEMLQRHEMLRTSFLERDGRPVQVIAEHSTLVLSLIDLSNVAERVQDAEIRRCVTQDAETPFTLSRGPLIRATLFRLGSMEHVLVVNQHHITTDGWSQTIFLRELTRLYDAFAAGQPAPLSPLPMQYADYALWHRQWLQGEILEQQLAYWRKQLADAPSLLELPGDYLRPTVQSYRGARHSFELSPRLSHSLQALSQQEGVTLYMMLLSAFATLLWRYTGQDDVVVGTPVAGRMTAEVEGLIGFFVNILVMRSDLSGDPTFRALLRQVQKMALGAYAHQDIPFERVVQELQPRRSLSHHPLVQVIFALENVLIDNLELSQLGLELLDLDTGMTKFDLAALVWESGDRLVGAFEYNTDLFAAATIELIIGHWQRLLESVVAAPEQHLSQLSWLSEAEQNQLLSEWNDTSQAYAREECVHQMFEAQVEQRPEAIAVTFAGAQLSDPALAITYCELNQRANQLAHYLRKIGVGPETLVGICLERSLEMIIAVLGVLKAGGAYVPLDPLYPQARLAFMLANSQLPVLVTHKRLAEALPGHDAQIVRLDDDWEVLAQEQSENVTSGVMVSNLAYMIYTSGSTGMPKGVLIEHGGVRNLTEAQQRLFGARPGAHVLQFATLNFDAAASEIFVTLCAGATLCLTAGEVVQSPTQFTQVLQEQAITMVTLPPTMLAELADEQLPEVSTVISAGEACPAELAARWGAERLFINAYGPTEVTVCTTTSECHDADKPPIGRPIANTQVYILDNYRQPAPIGVPGEMYIGGAGVARGYLKRPELTAEKFVPDPFSREAGARLYRTGDIGRYRVDGQIEFLGRLDHQVKLRGYRIEPGEIEALLAQHVAVQEAVVIVREDTPGDRRLVAYVVPASNATVTGQELRQALQDRLPSYMLPTAIVLLPAFPLLPNGKIDRSALPNPQQSHLEREESYEAPRTPMEEQVAAIWREVLRLERIGIRDDFFALGGHSLLATQVLSRIRKAYAVNVPLPTFFESPTIASLVEYLPKNRQEAQQAIEEEAFHIPTLSRGESDVEALVEMLEQLSEEEVRALLAADVGIEGVNFP